MTCSPVITREQMMARLLRADPTFEPAWRAFLTEWKDDVELPYYAALTRLARHLIAQLESGATDNFDSVFEVMELLIRSGDEYVQTAAVIGLVEDLQNTNLHQRTVPSDFKPWLKQETARCWEEVNHFWSEGNPTTD